MTARTAALACLFIFPLATAARSDPAAAHPWARHKPGSWVKVKTTTKLSNESMAEETRFTLVEVTPDYYTLKIETSMGGNSLPSTEVKVPVDEGQEPAWKWEDKGSEELDVDGKKLKCAVRAGVSPDGKSTKTVWTAEVDGAALDVQTKLKLVAGGGERSETRIVRRLSETVKIGGKELKCWVRESVREGEGQRTEATIWESRDVPGMAVKSESRTTSGAMVISSTREVVEFEAK
ncbi:MAG: hypothetical protein HYY18_22495 [Planctomycetes bacterium]|nr:hypothetical protein [Planctomycetota bacterium]